MPRLQVVNGPALPLTWTVDGSNSLRIESVSASVDFTLGAGPAYVDVLYRDPGGVLIAQSRSSAALVAPVVYEVTFAPFLPDSNETSSIFLGRQAQSGLVATSLPPGATVTVSLDVANVTVTQMRIWVEDEGADVGADDAGALAGGRWAYVPGPGS